VARQTVSRDPEAAGRASRFVTIALVALCGIFALLDFASPTMFAYFDAVAADYEVALPGIDRWLPARVAYLFVNGYNRQRALDARSPRDLTAQLSLHGPSHPPSDAGATPLDVDATAVALGNGFPLAPGAYDVSFDLDVTPACRGGDVAVTAIAVTRWPHPLTVERERVSGPRVVVRRMVVDDHDAALGPVDVRIQGLEGCVHVARVLLTTAP
jgi:hypothetical protein